MPLYLKIGLFTCAFYLAVLIILEAAKIAMVHWRGGWGISYAGQRAWLFCDIVFYGLIWLACFRLARHLVWRTLSFPSPGGSFHVSG